MGNFSLYGITAMVVSALLVAGCGTTSILESKKVDYKSAGKLPPLDVPPDLTVPSADDRYVVPDIGTQGTATYSAYTKERAGQPQAGSTYLLPAVEKVRIERAGSQRWLVVPGTPETVWPVIKEFWQEMGFLVKVELPEAGVMETDWAENRAKIPQDLLRNLLGKLIDQAYSTAERDKFRTRLERGPDGTGTEIYISHRGMYEVFETGEYGAGGSSGRTVWQPRPADPELEAEMLRRLMVRFGVEEARAKAQIAGENLPERAKISREREGGGTLTLNDAFDRAWRRVGLALDRIGFTVEDRDRSQGVYFVRYVNPEVDSKKQGKGLLEKLVFWQSDDSDKNKAAQYRIVVKDTASGSQVNVLNKDGNPDTSATAVRILNLLYEQLK